MTSDGGDSNRIIVRQDSYSFIFFSPNKHFILWEEDYSMEKLLKALEKLYSEQNNFYQEDGWTGFNKSDLYNEVVNLCDEYLITNDGQCNWNNIVILQNNGYDVFAGEKDSFGWLTGCVQKDNDERVVIYG